MALPFRYNLLSLMARPTSTWSSIGLIAIVIGAFAYLQAVTDSAFDTMVATGDRNTILVISQSASNETISGLPNDVVNRLEMTPTAVRDASGPIISPELVGISSAFAKGDREVAVNTCVRGVDFEKACQVRHDKVKIIEGRPFKAGTYEVVVGEAAHGQYQDYGLGDFIQIGTRGIRRFEVVGIFSSGGTAADSEVWGYVETLRDVYGRGGYSSARLLVADEPAGREAIAFIEGPSVELTAKTEREYFTDINTNQNTNQVLAVAMIVIMGVAAAFAVANTMYAAVAGRTGEIGMLRALGFGRNNILVAFVLEGMLLAFGGGLLGCALSLLSDGVQKNMLPTTFTTVSYSLAITPKIIGTSLGVAVVIGFVGSIMPAWRAARMRIVVALREQ